jgi:hypothetical protein
MIHDGRVRIDNADTTVLCLLADGSGHFVFVNYPKKEKIVSVRLA